MPDKKEEKPEVVLSQAKPAPDTAADNQEKAQETPVTAADNTPKTGILADKSPEEIEKLRHEKKGARRAFHAVNFLGLHMLFNSTTSLLICYNLIPTKFAQSAMNWMGNSFVGKAAHSVFSLPGKAVDGILSLGGKSGSSKTMSEAEKLFEARHSARSSIETMFMCIAGCVALWPVKYLEDHRVGFLNKVDNWLHPGRSEQEKKVLALKPGEEPKETWGNLLRARVIGLTVVFSVDRLQQNFNNWRIRLGKGNADTFAWKFGSDAYRKMNHGVREWLVNFFSRKNVNLKGLQPMIRTHLLQTIDSHPDLLAHNEEINTLQTQITKTTDKHLQHKLEQEIDHLKDAFSKSHPEMKPEVERAIFAEQSRLLLTKELWLTALISVVIYTAAKAPFAHRWMEKIGLAKKGKHEMGATPEMAAASVDTPLETAPESPDKQEKRWAEQKENKRPKPKITEPTTSFQEALAQKAPGNEAAAVIG